jgi:hypothetical protein
MNVCHADARLFASIEIQGCSRAGMISGQTAF